jgi:hypothetical protein
VRAVAHIAIDGRKLSERYRCREVGSGYACCVLGGMSQSDRFSNAFKVFVAVTEIEANVGVS